jgi:hypothetical protein
MRQNNKNVSPENNSKRSLEKLARKLRRKHFNFPNVQCSACVTRARREAARQKEITTLESALVRHGDPHLIEIAYPALAALIQEQLAEMVQFSNGNPDF